MLAIIALLNICATTLKLLASVSMFWMSKSIKLDSNYNTSLLLGGQEIKMLFRLQLKSM